MLSQVYKKPGENTSPGGKNEKPREKILPGLQVTLYLPSIRGKYIGIDDALLELT